MRFCTVNITHDCPEKAMVVSNTYHQLNDALRWMDHEFQDQPPICSTSNPAAFDQEQMEMGIPALIASASDKERTCFILRATETGKSSITFAPYGYGINHPLRYCLDEVGRAPITEEVGIQRTPLCIKLIF